MRNFLPYTILSTFLLATSSFLPLSKASVSTLNIKDEKAFCQSVYKAAQQGDEKTLENHMRVLLGRKYKCSGFNQFSNSKDDGSSLLHLAARHGDISAAKLLVKQGFPLELKNMYGDTFLHVALYNKHIDLVKEILPMLSKKELKETGLLEVREERIGDTVLHLACDSHLVSNDKSEELITLLLTKGAPARVLNDEKQSPRDIAIFHGSLNLVPVLDEFIDGEIELEELMLKEANPEASLMATLGLVTSVGVGIIILYKLLNYVHYKKLSGSAKKIL